MLCVAALGDCASRRIAGPTTAAMHSIMGVIAVLEGLIFHDHMYAPWFEFFCNPPLLAHQLRVTM